MLPGKWYRDMVAPHLHWLSVVVREWGGSPWGFDPAALERPAVPDDPADPSDDQVNDRIRQADLPGENTRKSIKQFCTVRDIYFNLQERGTATRDELWQRFDPNTYQALKITNTHLAGHGGHRLAGTAWKIYRGSIPRSCLPVNGATSGCSSDER